MLVVSLVILSSCSSVNSFEVQSQTSDIGDLVSSLEKEEISSEEKDVFHTEDFFGENIPYDSVEKLILNDSFSCVLTEDISSLITPQSNTQIRWIDDNSFIIVTVDSLISNEVIINNMTVYHGNIVEKTFKKLYSGTVGDNFINKVSVTKINNQDVIFG